MPAPTPTPLAVLTLALAAAAALLAPQVQASEFSVTPTRIELRPGAMSDTITVVNHAQSTLRVAIRLVEWTQDAQGNDVYADTTDLVYFPRQMEVGPDARRVVRVGARAPAGTSERTYRVFIEEQPDALPPDARNQIAVAFRFGVPVFLAPAGAKPQAELSEPSLAAGRLSLLVKNSGNQHLRVNTIRVSDGAGYTQEVQGWYALAGAQRTFSIELPRDACRKARTLQVTLEGNGIQAGKSIDVDPARCG